MASQAELSRALKMLSDLRKVATEASNATYYLPSSLNLVAGSLESAVKAWENARHIGNFGECTQKVQRALQTLESKNVVQFEVAIYRSITTVQRNFSRAVQDAKRRGQVKELVSGLLKDWRELEAMLNKLRNRLISLKSSLNNATVKDLAQLVSLCRDSIDKVRRMKGNIDSGIVAVIMEEYSQKSQERLAA